MSVTYSDIGWFLVIFTVVVAFLACGTSVALDLWATWDTKKRLRRMAEAQRAVSELLRRAAK